jgi:hypothetical protein
VLQLLYSVGLDGEIEEYTIVKASRIALHVNRIKPASNFTWTVKRRTWRSGTKQFYATLEEALVAAIKQRQEAIAHLEDAIRIQQQQIAEKMVELTHLRRAELAEI